MTNLEFVTNHLRVEYPDPEFGLKPVTVRLTPSLIAQLEFLAKHLNCSRQALMSQIISVGVTDVFDAILHLSGDEDFIREFQQAGEKED